MASRGADEQRWAQAPLTPRSPVPPADRILDEHRDRQPGERAAAPRAGVRRGRPGTRPLPGRGRHQAPYAGVRGGCDQAPGPRRARDLHGPQAVLRGWSRADVSPAFAQDRADRGGGPRRRPAREALLPARTRGQACPGPRAAQRDPRAGGRARPGQRGRRSRPSPRHSAFRDRCGGRGSGRECLGCGRDLRGGGGGLGLGSGRDLRGGARSEPEAPVAETSATDDEEQE